jgi:hypothetical protein
LLPAGAVAGWGSHPLESAALSRRTPVSDIGPIRSVVLFSFNGDVEVSFLI